MSMHFNRAVRMIDPTRSTRKSPIASENLSIVGLPTRHHQHHANRLHETRNAGVMRRNRVRGGKRRLICYLPDFAHVRMIAKTWMKSEQSCPVMLTVIWLLWIVAMTPCRFYDGTERRNSWWKRIADIRLILVRLTTLLAKTVCTSSLWRRFPNRRAELAVKAQTGHRCPPFCQDSWTRLRSSPSRFYELQLCLCAQENGALHNIGPLIGDCGAVPSLCSESRKFQARVLK